MLDKPETNEKSDCSLAGRYIRIEQPAGTAAGEGIPRLLPVYVG